MATRKAAKKAAAPKTAYGKAGSLVKSAVSGAKSLLTGKKAKGTGKARRKKSMVWYVKETARLKAKKRYEKIKLNV